MRQQKDTHRWSAHIVEPCFPVTRHEALTKAMTGLDPANSRSVKGARYKISWEAIFSICVGQASPQGQKADLWLPKVQGNGKGMLAGTKVRPCVLKTTKPYILNG